MLKPNNHDTKGAFKASMRNKITKVGIMSEVRYSAESNAFAEAAAPVVRTARAPISTKVSKTPRIPRAEKEDSRAESAQRWRVADAMRKAAAGEYIIHGFSYFTKEAVDELKGMGLRFATDKDKAADSLYMENVDGHLREVKVCALEQPAKIIKKAEKPVVAANDAIVEIPQQAQPASAGTAGDQVQNPARATTAPRQTTTAPVARPA